MQVDLLRSELRGEGEVVEVEGRLLLAVEEAAEEEGEGDQA